MNIKAKGYTIPESAQAAIRLLDYEQQKRIFVILVFAIYNKIAKEDWYPITFCPQENGLVAMYGDKKFLFYFYPAADKKDMLYIQRILKIVLGMKTKQEVRAKLLSFASDDLKGLADMLCEVFAHHSMNNIFPWTLNSNNVFSFSNPKQLVIENEFQKDLVEIVKITKIFAPVVEKTVKVTKSSGRKKGIYFVN